MSTFDYHAKCKRIIRLAREELITKTQASEELWKIEEAAYEAYPDAEPDGDITYCVAVAVGEIASG